MKKPVKHFDLPKQHLIGEHYIPARARQTAEIERRRSLPRGTVLLEQQRDGLAIVQHIFEQAEDEHDLAYIQDVLAACALNSGWYTNVRNSDKMRGCLASSDLFDAETGEPRTPADMRAEAEAQLAAAVSAADALVAAHVENRLKPRQIFTAGRVIGTAGLYVASLPLNESTYSHDPFEASVARRDRQLTTLGRARTLIGEVGVNVSVAPLADPDSKVSGYVRRTITNNGFESFEEAVEEVRRAA